MLGVLSLVHAGCPSPPEMGIVLIVSPTTLDFGSTETAMSFKVSKNYTSQAMAPFRVTSSDAWISLEPSTGTSNGPDDPITVSVTIKRDLLGAGTNSGTVRITCEGATDRWVQVTAFRQLAANFTVNEVQPFQGDPITFQDMSQVSGNVSGTKSWLWDFGDGATSEAQNPSHTYDTIGTFDVTLTVTVGEASAALTKRNYIMVREKIGPTAGFYALDTTVPAGSPVGFVDQSEPGTASITSWRWDFGDGRSGTGAAPTHAYALPGVYTVRLTVTTAHGQDEEVKQNYITVEAVPPQADFTCSNVEPLMGTEVTFTDLSVPGHLPIASWYWEFGDGAVSTERNPSHTYDTYGVFNVSLTVADAEGNQDTEIKTGYVSVRGYAPDASFNVDRSWGVTIDEFGFANTSDPGTGPATYRWRFGDGSESAQENPSHTYTVRGTYTVSLEVRNNFGVDTAQYTGLRVYDANALDRYVRKDDGIEPAVTTEPRQTFNGGRWDVLKFASQQWRDSAEVAPHIWQHWLGLAIPDVIRNKTALLFISGGDTNDAAPAPSAELTDFAVQAGSIVAVLTTVPNQPSVFTAEGASRSEDEILAYTFDQYLDGAAMNMADEEWPALLPMAKAAVRAMDVVQEYSASLAVPVTVEDFVVTGASKRGWTTWLTAATDHRVVGIAPMVIDVLNLDDQMDWHYSALCGYAEAIHDYVDMGVIDRLHTPEGDALQAIVDPYAYAERFAIPKLGLNGTADQFFVPDSAQFYYPEISNYGPMYLRYFPNGDHHLLEGYDATVRGMLPFYNAIVKRETLPSLEWQITDTTDEATLTVQLDRVPQAAYLWTGTVGQTSGVRDFRLDTVGPDVWQSTPISPVGTGGTSYAATVPSPAHGWTGYFMSFEFASGTAGEPHVFTTEVRCVPTMPPCYEPGGYGTIETAGTGTDAITVVRVGGTRFEMGYWYGYLLAEQIDAIWALFSAVAEAEFPAGTLDLAVSQLWNSEYFDTAAWGEELAGVAQGCRMAGYPGITVDVLKRILVIPDISEYGCSLFAAWGKATAGGEMYQLRNLDWSIELGAQNYPVVAIYEPTDGGIKHAVIGFAGLVGIAGGGMNGNGIAVSEIMGYFCDEEYLEGIPFPVLLRDVLYHDSTLTQALARMKGATRTNQYHYCIGDPNAPDPKARLLFTSRTRFDEWVDNQSVTGQHPCHPNVNPVHTALDDAVYWKNHNGRDNEIIYDGLFSRYGTLDAQGAIAIAKAAGVNSTVLSIVYHNSGGDFWVAYANGTDPAQNQGYVHILLNP